MTFATLFARAVDEACRDVARMEPSPWRYLGRLRFGPADEYAFKVEQPFLHVLYREREEMI